MEDKEKNADQLLTSFGVGTFEFEPLGVPSGVKRNLSGENPLQYEVFWDLSK